MYVYTLYRYIYQYIIDIIIITYTSTGLHGYNWTKLVGTDGCRPTGTQTVTWQGYRAKTATADAKDGDQNISWLFIYIWL